MKQAVFLAIALSLLLSGCNVVEGLTGKAARKEAHAAEVKERAQKTQLAVMRYADQFVDRAVRGTEGLLRHVPGRDDQVAIIEWQFSQATGAVQIAAGPNPMVNAADMVVMVSLGRRLIERDWIAHYGETARPLLQAYQSEERDAWLLLADLTEQQRAELNTLLDEWVQENPEEHNASFVRFGDFGGAGAKKTRRASPGLLSSIRIDPLADLDPAVREVEQTRLLAERAVYYAQRVPRLLDIQGQLIIARTRQSGELGKVMGTVEGVGQLSQSLTRLADETPALIAREREAAIEQVMRELQRQQRDMLALSQELRAAIEAGNMTAQSMEKLIQSTDRLVARFARDPSDTRPRGRPFDITEYTQAITELAATTRELQALVRDVDGAAPVLAGQVNALTARVQGLVDFAFWRLIMLVAAVLLAAIAYQLVVRRLRP